MHWLPSCHYLRMRKAALQIPDCTGLIIVHEPNHVSSKHRQHQVMLSHNASAYAGNCLQRLDLSDNPITGDVAESLAEMLRGQPHLRALNLNDTSLQDAGVSTIAQALANSGMPLPASTHHPATILIALLCVRLYSNYYWTSHICKLHACLKAHCKTFGLDSWGRGTLVTFALRCSHLHAVSQHF